MQNFSELAARFRKVADALEELAGVASDSPAPAPTPQRAKQVRKYGRKGKAHTNGVASTETPPASVSASGGRTELTSEQQRTFTSLMRSGASKDMIRKETGLHHKTVQRLMDEWDA